MVGRGTAIIARNVLMMGLWLVLLVLLLLVIMLPIQGSRIGHLRLSAMLTRLE